MSAHDHAAHDHAAHHRPGPALTTALLLTLLFALLETLGGYWSGSLALLGDAGHMLTDAVALGLAAVASWLATRPPSPRHSYGLGRAEVIAALLNALFMLVVVSLIATEAIERLGRPAEVKGGAVILIAVGGLAINALVAWILSRGEATLNVRAALLHVLADMLGSLAALGSGVVIYLTGWSPIDSISALIVCLLILYSTLRLLRESLHVMMEGVPFYLDLRKVGMAMAGVERVRAVHDLHIWTLASGNVALSAHVVLEDFRQWELTLATLNRLLHDEFGIEHTTLQPEVATTPHRLHPMPWRRRRDDPKGSAE